MTLTGVLAPLPTPFDDRDQVDLSRLRVALRHWIASPLTGFVVLGTTGEAGLLTEEESDRLVGEARASVPADRTFIVGAGRESTGASIRAAKRAAGLGADAVLVRTPSFFKAHMTDKALVRYYTAVADASPVPVLLYNFTSSTGVNLLPGTAARLATHLNIAGIKESGNDVAQIAALVSLSSTRFSVLSGSGSTFYDALRAGVGGGILALAALLPDACVRLFGLVREGQLAEAQALQERLLPVARLVSAGYGVPGLKAALKVAGVDVGWPRAPLMPVGPDGVSALASALSRFANVLA